MNYTWPCESVSIVLGNVLNLIKKAYFCGESNQLQ